MTTKEYVLKYKLDISDKFNHQLFVEDLTQELIALLEINKAKDNIKGFDNAVRCIRMKFDAISNKTVGILPEKLWNYFFATVIVKMKETLCPKAVQKQKEERERKQKDYEQRKKQREWEESQFNDYFSFFSYMFYKPAKTIPIQSFEVLEIPSSSNEEEVKTAYKKLALKHHPDKGGKQDKFIEITNAKNTCLNYLSNK